MNTPVDGQWHYSIGNAEVTEAEYYAMKLWEKGLGPCPDLSHHGIYCSNGGSVPAYSVQVVTRDGYD